MSLKIATVGRQRSVATLARAVFDIDDRPELQARAEEALLRANPGLAARGGLKTGETIVVPDTPGLRASDKVRRAPRAAALPPEVAAPRAEARVAAAKKLIETTRKADETQRAQLKERSFAAAFAAGHPKLREELKTVAEAAAAAGEGEVRRAELLLDAIQRIHEDQKRIDARRGR